MYHQHQEDGSRSEQFHTAPSTADSPFARSQFTSPIYGIDPALHSDSQHLHPADVSRLSNRHSPQMRHSSVGARGSTVPPRSSPLSGNAGSPPRRTPAFRPSDRSLPTVEVDAGNITDAFVQFILYCNPNFPLDVDTSTLRSTFQNPPKSDSKDFETYRLFELIRKLDAKDIKTWGQLALDLGVEAPDTSRGQSVQKVQQYTVRLKRWMRAMHIDAFFEYLLGKQHTYFNDIPHPSDPYSTGGRDGVLPEEDLAIRALDPSFRPKRGRRRNSEIEHEDSIEAEANDPQPSDRSTPYQHGPMSAVPVSGRLDSFNDPWTAASAISPHSFAPWSGRPSAAPGGSHLRWQAGQAGSPSTPHPLSAIPASMSAHIDAAFEGEPKSATTPSRKRRRHGPAVSSAWPSTNNPGAKPRGRPPASRNVQDGPYNTFPADPANEKTRPSDPLPTPVTAEERPTSEQPLESQPASSTSGGRPGRLSLQVPQHTGNPVRLATPPTLLLNGESKDSETRIGSEDPAQYVVAVTAADHRPRPQPYTMDNSSTPLTFETLKRVVASDLLRADVIGRRQRLTGDEAKRLADAVLDRLAVPRSETGDLQQHLTCVTAASWLGVGDYVGIPPGPSAGHGKRLKVTRFRTDPEGYEEIIFDEHEMEDVREIFDLYWHASQGGCMGNFEMKGLSLAGAQETAIATESTHDLVVRKTFEALHNLEKEGWLHRSMREIAQSTARIPHDSNDGIDWRARCLAMEFGANVAKGEVERAKQRILDKLIDAVL